MDPKNLLEVVSNLSLLTLNLKLITQINHNQKRSLKMKFLKKKKMLRLIWILKNLHQMKNYQLIKNKNLQQLLLLMEWKQFLRFKKKQLLKLISRWWSKMMNRILIKNNHNQIFKRALWLYKNNLQNLKNLKEFNNCNKLDNHLEKKIRMRLIWDAQKKS